MKLRLFLGLLFGLSIIAGAVVKSSPDARAARVCSGTWEGPAMNITATNDATGQYYGNIDLDYDDDGFTYGETTITVPYGVKVRFRGSAQAADQGQPSRMWAPYEPNTSPTFLEGTFDVTRTWWSDYLTEGGGEFGWSIDAKCNGTISNDWSGGDGLIIINVNVSNPAPTVDLKERVGTSGSYTNGPITVAYNGTAQLNWVTTNSPTSCTASNAWSGSKAVGGGTQTLNNLTSSGTYTITCSNSAGSASDTVVINVSPPPGPDPFSIELDDVYFHRAHCDYNVDWNDVNYASNYEVFKREGSSGSFVSQGTTTSTRMIVDGRSWVQNYFKVDAISATGQRTTSNTVNGICPAPTVDLKVRAGTSGSYTNGPITVPYNGTAQLNWVTSNATSCTASNAWSGSKTAAGGTQTLNNLTTSGTYVLACSNPGGTVTDTPVVINVSAPPVPVITISTNPTTVDYNNASTITWSVDNATSCTASGDWSGSKNATGGSQSTGNLTQVRLHTYTLSCTGIGGTDIESATVNVNPPTPDAPTNVTATEPNYCISGPGATISWTYSDGSGSPQSAYQVQIDDQSSFNSPEVDSGKISSGANSWATSPGQLTFGVTYRARVRTWNGYDVVSGWSNASNTWSAPQYPYPQVDFTWTTPVQEDVAVPFTDQTVFGGGSVAGRDWSWNFGDGGSSTAQNPTHTFANTGNFTITLTASDSAGQSCSIQKNISVQKPIPIIKEVAPK